jgi:hemerythrin-like domain-containing protein
MSPRAESLTRRQMMRAAGASAAVIVAGCAGTNSRRNGATISEQTEEHEEEVSPNEDLMREHGLLERILLVYEEAVARLDAGRDMPPEVLVGCAGIVRKFVEDYHEKLEEDFVFPRLERARRLADLVATLRTQHQSGRRLTDEITRLATKASIAAEASRRDLTVALRAFIRMYRPHAAREDTVLFPAFREVVSKPEYGELGEQFEHKEHELFGKEGFSGMVDAVAKLERDLRIDDLATFTPSPSA